eukprot:scaffold63490_cov66-Cyclotella_meneghiniana.AAC.3
MHNFKVATKHTLPSNLSDELNVLMFTFGTENRSRGRYVVITGRCSRPQHNLYCFQCTVKLRTTIMDYRHAMLANHPRKIKYRNCFSVDLFLSIVVVTSTSAGRGGGGCDLSGKKGEKRELSPKKSNSAPMVFKTTTGNPVQWDSSQGQMTMKQSCSLAFQRCFHFNLIPS